ncbi:nucleoside deaminase [Gammaproteobacteria bacterium]|jgi:tRNA(adenine34) deaminase|nr:nucleoside deaminase [Gammaproteobacteria bacterium]MDA8604830.1 nucleoside deaminase [Gammaproteobacteria bacterium]MDA8733209.1 nucleoside deaminase [Gammaproteobacteria bacterium]MDA9570371.1 nucleoside deaminase [Gammaproteobacteria bacterium]MDA9921301.1 nucleoside deaminase [Gammaproteobacteria bacterium]
MFTSDDSSFMGLAIQEAEKAFTNNEVPVGAIIVQQNKIIGKGRNRVIENQNVSSHAEIEAIIDASKNVKNYRLNKSTIYISLEPCHMCVKAIVDARIDEIVFAAPEPKTGSIISIDNLLDRISFNHKVSYRYGLMKEESSKLLKDFFKNKR